MCKSILRSLALTIGIFLMSVFCAVSMFLNTAVNGETYYEIQLEENVSPGVDNETMLELDILLGNYLAGDADALDSTELFNADEKAHMVDVFNIFAALRTIKNISFVISMPLLGWVFYSKRHFSARLLRTGIIAGTLMLFLPIIAAGAWAFIDFDAAFTAMHHLLFSNDLWLMDPRTDLMIRMLPERFFVSMGTRLAIRAVLGAVAVPAIVFIGTFDFSGKETKND